MTRPIAKGLKRSPGAVGARINSLRRQPRDLPFSAQPRSLPSERLAAYAKSGKRTKLPCSTGH